MATTTTVEIELAGRGNGWTDISSHVAISASLQLDYGISGTGPADLMASPGVFSFALLNATIGNKVADGYYSLNHANKRSGFDLGCRVRLRFAVGAVTIYKFVGRIDAVRPDAGSYGQRLSYVTCVDWMEEAANTTVPSLTLLEDSRGDEAFEALVGECAEQPNAIEVAGEGSETYLYCFDNTREETVAVLTELQRLAASGGDYIYIKGDSSVGGVLTYEPRTVRGRTADNVVTFRDTELLTGLDVASSRKDVINVMRLVIHPRYVDTAATSVLFTLRNSIAVGPGDTFNLLVSYYDPNQLAEKVGGTDMKTPLVANTDWTANTLGDGTGSDVSANFTVTPSYGPNGARVAILNSGSETAYLTSLVLTGRGIYDYANISIDSEDSDSQENYGARVVVIDMPYQNDPSVAKDLSAYLLSLRQSPAAHVRGATLIANLRDDTSVLKVLQREPSDRVGVVEAQTGIDTEDPVTSGCRGFFIHRLRYTITSSFIVAEFSLAPADSAVYWALEVPGQSEMDWTTRLAYFSAIGHIDVAHGDTHTDSAHTDTPHGDSHTDSAHVDDAHADSEHTDVAHSDVTHADVAHADGSYSDSHTDTPHADAYSDVAHADVAHSDVAHGDVAYVDSHSDVAHIDAPHEDTHTDSAHADVAHGDVAYGDTHADTAHVDTPHYDTPYGDDTHYDEFEVHTDTPHEDSPHQDIAHEDTHTDTAHVDTAHEDVAHGDVAHVDEPYEDSAHGDTAHVDTAHTDSPHSDSHTDSAHVDAHTDVTHVDSHTDAAHADSAHSDVAHSDVTHVDEGHADAAHADVAHGDVAHADSLHDDVAHVDEHLDTEHGDA